MKSPAPKILLIASCIVTASILVSCEQNDGDILVQPGTTNCNIPDTVSYEKNITPIIKNYCLACHNNSFPQALVSFSSHSQVREYALNGRLMGTINHENGFAPMPKSAPQLDECKRITINKWIKAGAPDN